jgi:hypothetical protein
MSTKVKAEQWCNHDTAAIHNGVCECGAQVRAFPTAAALIKSLRTEFGLIGRDRASLAAGLPSDGCGFTIDLGEHSGHEYICTLARMGGWYLLIPYRTDEAISKQ